MGLQPRARWFVLAATGIWSASAFAAPPDAERLKAAAEEFDSGRRAFKIKDFENSAAHFENADRDAPSPEALQSAIRARKEAGHTSRAATLAALALSRYPADKAVGDYARQILSESERLLYRLAVTCAPECAIVVDNKLMPFPETSNAVIYLDAGAHVVAATWPNNRHKNADVAAIAGSGAKLSFTAPTEKVTAVSDAAAASPATDPAIPQAEADPGAQEQPKSGLPPAVFFVGVGATAILGGVTIWSGIDTTNNPGTQRVTAECKGFSNIADCPTYQLGLDHERRTNILIAATSVVGVTTAVIGLVFTRWGGDEPAKPDKKDALIVPTLGIRDGVNIGVVGRF
jgi:hypothetical protein